MQRKNTLSVLTLMKEERGRLSVGIILAILCSALSFVPYFIIYQMILSLIQQNAFFLQLPIWGYGCRGGCYFTKCTAIMCHHLHTHGGIQYHAPPETPCAGTSLPAESWLFP